MEVAHGAVPCAGNHGEEGEAGEEMDVLHFFEVFVIGEEEQGSKTGEEKTDGALGEDGKGGGYVAEVVVPSVFGIVVVALPFSNETHTLSDRIPRLLLLPVAMMCILVDSLRLEDHQHDRTGNN